MQNVIERAVILSDGDTFSVDKSWLRRKPAETMSSRAGLAQREVEMIKAALVESEGRIGGPPGAAAKLTVPRQTLESRIKSLGINKYGYKVRSVK